jgi:hypothetical protein
MNNNTIMTSKKGEDDNIIQGKIEKLLRDNPSKSYSKEEIINLLSSSDISMKEKTEKILGEMEIWISMKDMQSSVYSSCKGGTVYFQWGQTP